MGFLGNLFGSIGNTVSSWFGGGQNQQSQQDQDQKKQQQQNQAAATPATPVSQLNGRESTPAPQNTLNLQSLTNQLKPVAPKPQPVVPPPPPTQVHQLTSIQPNPLNNLNRVGANPMPAYQPFNQQSITNQLHNQPAPADQHPIQDWWNSSTPLAIPSIPGYSDQFAKAHPLLNGTLNTTRFIPNMAIGLTNAVVGQGIVNPLLDMANNASRSGHALTGDVQGNSPVLYSNLKSAPMRAGYQLLASMDHTTAAQNGINTSPTETMANIGGVLNPIANAWLGGKVGDGAAAIEDGGQGIMNLIRSGAVQGSKVGAATGFTGTLADSHDAPDVGTQALQTAIGTATGGAVGGVLGAAGGAAGPVISNLLGRAIDRFGGNAGSEVAAGIKSVNPNQAEDAAAPLMKQQADQAAQAAATAPPQHQADLEKIIQGGGSKQDVQTYINGLPLNEQQMATESVSKLMGNLPDESKMTPPTAAKGATPQPEPAPTPAPPPVPEPAPIPTPEGQQVPPTGEVPPTGQQVPPEGQVPPNQGQAGPIPDQGPAAPNTHDAMVKALGDKWNQFKGKYSMKDNVNLTDLKNESDRVVSQMSDDQLMKAYGATDAKNVINDARSYSLARSALDRLSKLPDDPTAVQTVSNIMDSLDHAVSNGGLTLRLAQEEFDKMPLPMKVRYIIKKVDAANLGKDGYEPLATNQAAAADVEQKLTDGLGKSQAISETLTALEGKMNQVADDANNGKISAVDTKSLGSEINQQKQNLAAQNGEVVKYFSSLIPGQGKAQQALSNFPRTMMLGSFTGRANDIITTASNVLHNSATDLVQGALSKVINHFSPGLVSDTSKGFGRLFTGGVDGAIQSGHEFAGTQYAPDLEAAIRNNTNLRSGMQRSSGIINRTVQNATELATNLTEGVRQQRLYQLADQEAAKNNLTGEFRQQYATARSFVPSEQMAASANELKMNMNNLNNNPLSNVLGKISKDIKGDTPIGGFFKNQTLPFTSWTAGNIWNSITDRNVVANAINAGRSARQRDVEGVVRNISKGAVNGASAYALGYVLSQNGVITNTDAQGHNNAGAYVHIGNSYVPVGLFGAFAPSMLMGNAAYNGINNNGGKNAAAVTAEQMVTNATNSLNVLGAFGESSNLRKAINAGTGAGKNIVDGISSFLSGAAGQYVPAVAGDVNAVLDNYTSLNPTHEAADTKAINPNSPSGTAKDTLMTSVNQLQNRIPGLSQMLPRQAGVAAPTLLDRVTHGNQDTPTSIQNRSDAQSAVDFSKTMKEQDIPDYTAKIGKGGASFDDQVQTRVEGGEYDKAISALQAKLDHESQDSNIPPSKLAAQKDAITKLQVTSDGHFDPKIIDQYKKTSLSEWHDMGDPKSVNYDPATYQMLYQYDTNLAQNGVSKNNTKATSNFYTEKAPAKGRSGGARLANNNLLGATPNLGKISFGNLSSKAIGVAPVPAVTRLASANLVPRHQISVTKVQ